MLVPSYRLEFYPRLYVNSITRGLQEFDFGGKNRNITDPVVQIKNPMVDGGIHIPGFNDDYKGRAPDAGAFEVGAAPFEFGRRAYYNYDEGWAPWEKILAGKSEGFLPLRGFACAPATAHPRLLILSPSSGSALLRS